LLGASAFDYDARVFSTAPNAPCLAKIAHGGRRMRRAWAAIAAACVLLACSNTGTYVWYTTMPRTAWGTPGGEYVIGVGDTIAVRVYEQEPLSLSSKIRSDGRVAMPLVGELMVAGKHPSALAREIEARLKPFILTPRVTVNVESSQPIVISTLGEIKTVGSLTLERPGILIQALAQAGGPAEFADDSRIFVLRQFPSFQRIRFTYDAIVKNEAGAATFPLRTGDVIVIE
jgi:polysaccharide export outer membrane protein